ncbi:YbgA family protein [Gallaecimonas pentaromativorans]|uniref:YbgA family protein n=1 Tax=Gallaecimonas pentaromativorans TaxID=584787 RepID=UPI003A91DED5
MEIKVGVSACVIGQQVRFDGGHKLSRFISDELGRHFRFVPVCPEMAIGMGSPRPTIRLVGDPEHPRVQGTKGPELDVTEQLKAFADTALPGMSELSGYLLCAKSPTCGMERVRVYRPDGEGLGKVGVGVFAKALIARFPNLPVEEDGRLNDPLLRENFVLRVMAYHQWQQLRLDGLTLAGLMAFHRRHKFLLLAHNQPVYRELGPMLAAADTATLKEVAEAYISRFMQALQSPASRKDHTNVLMHLQGFFKKMLSGTEKQELSELIQQYRQGLVPLVAPLTLINHHLRLHPVGYLAEQSYLNPYPADLKLRYGL